MFAILTFIHDFQSFVLALNVPPLPRCIFYVHFDSVRVPVWQAQSSEREREGEANDWNRREREREWEGEEEWEGEWHQICHFDTFRTQKNFIKFLSIWIKISPLEVFLTQLFPFCLKTQERDKGRHCRVLLTRAKKFVWQSSRLAPFVWCDGCVIVSPFFPLSLETLPDLIRPEIPKREHKTLRTFRRVFTFQWRLQNGRPWETTSAVAAPLVVTPGTNFTGQTDFGLISLYGSKENGCA